MLFRILSISAVLCILSGQVLGQSNAPADVHPKLFASPDDWSAINKKIKSEPWAQKSWAELKAQIDPYVIRHQTDPTWIVSRLAMYWKEGAHYTQCYIKDQNWDYGEGNAPVPTVRLPGMRIWNDYVNVPLEDRTPYNETGDLLGISRSSGDKTPIVIPYKETGHMIRFNNMEILTLAEKSAFAYYITKDEKYAKFSSDILWTWLLGTYYMEPPLDPEQSSKGPGGYEPGGILGYYDYEVIHDDLQRPAAFTYDFLHDYMSQHPHDHLKQTGLSLTDLGGVVFKRFIEIGLVRGGSKGNWNVNRNRLVLNSMLVLEPNAYYADGKGREHYIPFYTKVSGKYHAALPDIIKNYNAQTGLWPESPGYASGMIGAVLEMAVPLYKMGVNTIGDNPLIQKAAMANLGWLDARGNLVEFGDMRGGPIAFDVFERLLSYYTWEGDTENAKKVAAVLDKAISSGQYSREETNWKGIILNEPLPASSTSLPYHKAAYSPFHRHMIMRNGNDEENGMMFTLYGGRHQSHLSSNGLTWQFYGKGWSLAPDGSAYESYWTPDMKYHQSVTGVNTITQGYQEGEITINAMDPAVPADQFYNTTVTSEYCSFADVSADEKRRLIVMVRTSETTGYYVDIFRSDLLNNDYLHHNLGNTHRLTNTKGENLGLKNTELDEFPHPAYSFFKNARMVQYEKDFLSSWTINTVSPSLHVDMWMMGQANRELYQLDAPPTTLRGDVTPGQVNRSPGTTPALIVRQKNNNAKAFPFVAVFEAYNEGEKSIQEISKLQTSENFVSLVVKSKTSQQSIYNATDNGIYQPEKGTSFSGTLGIVSMQGKELQYLYLGKGKLLKSGGYQIEAENAPATVELRMKDGKYYYTSDQPIRITLEKGKAKLYPTGTNVLLKENPNMLQEPDMELTIEFETELHLDSVLKESVKKKLQKLTIQIEENKKTWVVFPKIPGNEESNNSPSYQIKKPIGHLPKLKGMPALKNLDISFLGLNNLPAGLSELGSLEILDISFNNIEISNELDTIKKMKMLKELYVFGLRIQKSDIEELTSNDKELKIFYTQKQCMEFLERSGKLTYK